MGRVLPELREGSKVFFHLEELRYVGEKTVLGVLTDRWSLTKARKAKKKRKRKLKWSMKSHLLFIDRYNHDAHREKRSRA